MESSAASASAPEGAAGEGVPLDSLNLDEFASWRSRSSRCYEKFKIVGIGRYGVVHKAREKETKELVALKKIVGICEKEKLVTARREIKILEALNNENVIRLKEIVFSPVRKNDDQGKPVGNELVGGVYMVFEYMDHDLAGLSASEEQFTVPQIKCYMKQLLTGVHYCHIKHVMHRDIKGANILINNEGYLKLADFGLARTFSKDDGGKFTDQLVTLWYRPPELLLGETEYGPAVDMWSVGCVFGELLNGKAIFPGDTEKNQFEVICETCGTPDEDTWPGAYKLPKYQSYMLPSPVRRQVRERFKHFDPHALELLERMLTLNPAQRISAEEALDADYFRVDPLPSDRESLPKYKFEAHAYEAKRKEWSERMLGLDPELPLTLEHPLVSPGVSRYLQFPNPSPEAFPPWSDHYSPIGDQSQQHDQQ